MKNIILIGMSDSEKTTIGKTLSKNIGFKFVDTEDNLGKEAVHELSRLENSVISTGVEIIKNPSNVKALRENGVIIFIDESGKSSIDNQEHIREEYEALKGCCDLHLVNNNNTDIIVDYISTTWS